MSDQLQQIFRSADRVPVGRPPTDRLLADGGRRRRRRHALRISSVAAAASAIAGAVLVLSGPDRATELPPSDQTPTPVPWAPLTPGPDPVPKGSVTPPLAGQPIDLQLIVPEQARRGEPLRFIVRIANLGSEPVSLEPCPHYRVQYLPHVETGYLNCEQAPDSIPPEGHLDFEMEIGVPRLERDIGGTYELLWQLGGEGAEGKTVTTPVELALSGVRVTVPSHCGVLSVTVDGQLWLADPPLGDHNPPPGWDENQTSGQWVVIGPQRAEFHGDQGQRASFRRAAPGAAGPNAGCE